jgi:hypothetical protein
MTYEYSAVEIFREGTSLNPLGNATANFTCRHLLRQPYNSASKQRQPLFTKDPPEPKLPTRL